MSSPWSAQSQNASVQSPTPVHPAPTAAPSRSPIVIRMHNVSAPSQKWTDEEQTDSKDTTSLDTKVRKFNFLMLAINIGIGLCLIAFASHSLSIVAKRSGEAKELEEKYWNCYDKSTKTFYVDQFEEICDEFGMTPDGVQAYYKIPRDDKSKPKSLLHASPRYKQATDTIVVNYIRVCYCIFFLCAVLRCMTVKETNVYTKTCKRFLICYILLSILWLLVAVTIPTLTTDYVVVTFTLGVYYFLAFRAMRDLSGKRARQLLPIYFVDTADDNAQSV